MSPGPDFAAFAPLLISGLNFSYRRTRVFKDFSFACDARILILRGPSGCGKTTLLKIISRNLPPDSVTQLVVPDAPFMLVQEDALAPWLTGMGNITKFTGISSSIVEAHAAFPHLSSFILKRSYQMSYGQRRLIELTRAILIAPPLLCLDEPFNFLDPKSRDLFTAMLLNDALLPNTRIVITSHYLEDFGSQRIPQFDFDGILPISRLSARKERQP